MAEVFEELVRNVVGLRIEKREFSATFDRDVTKAVAFDILSSMVGMAVRKWIPLAKSIRYKCGDKVEVKHGGEVDARIVRCEAVNYDGLHIHVAYVISDDGENVSAKVEGVEFKRGE